MRTRIYAIVSGLILAGIVELFFVSQSRIPRLATPGSKALLIAAYIAACAGLQLVGPREPEPSFRRLLERNALVAVTVSLCVAASIAVFHPAVMKDIPRDAAGVAGTALKVFVSLGLATMAVGIVSSVVAHRLGTLPARHS